MDAKYKAAITGGAGGALVGSIVGYLIDKGPGAGWGALVGGAAFALVGGTVTTSSDATPTVGAGRSPRGMGAAPQQRQVVRARGLAQLSPAPAR